MKIFINEKELLLNSTIKYNILEACLKIGIYIPHFCYNSFLTIAGNCRMCLVEIYKLNKPIISCLNMCIENIKIYTNSYKLKKLRENVMEFLLLNHPLDCPICDQAGECDLQEQSIIYGSDRSRFLDIKRTTKDINISKEVKLILNRCILCVRCVRFLIEYNLNKQIILGTIGRGINSKIHTYINDSIDFNLSGNIIDLCPVSIFNRNFCVDNNIFVLKQKRIRRTKLEVLKIKAEQEIQFQKNEQYYYEIFKDNSRFNFNRILNLCKLNVSLKYLDFLKEDYPLKLKVISDLNIPYFYKLKLKIIIHFYYINIKSLENLTYYDIDSQYIITNKYVKKNYPNFYDFLEFTILITKRKPRRTRKELKMEKQNINFVLFVDQFFIFEKISSSASANNIENPEVKRFNIIEVEDFEIAKIQIKKLLLKPTNSRFNYNKFFLVEESLAFDIAEQVKNNYTSNIFFNIKSWLHINLVDYRKLIKVEKKLHKIYLREHLRKTISFIYSQYSDCRINCDFLLYENLYTMNPIIFYERVQNYIYDRHLPLTEVESFIDFSILKIKFNLKVRQNNLIFDKYKFNIIHFFEYFEIITFIFTEFLLILLIKSKITLNTFLIFFGYHWQNLNEKILNILKQDIVNINFKYDEFDEFDKYISYPNCYQNIFLIDINNFKVITLSKFFNDLGVNFDKNNLKDSYIDEYKRSNIADIFYMLKNEMDIESDYDYIIYNNDLIFKNIKIFNYYQKKYNLFIKDFNKLFKIIDENIFNYFFYIGLYILFKDTNRELFLFDYNQFNLNLFSFLKLQYKNIFFNYKFKDFFKFIGSKNGFIFDDFTYYIEDLNINNSLVLFDLKNKIIQSYSYFISIKENKINYLTEKPKNFFKFTLKGFKNRVLNFYWRLRDKYFKKKKVKVKNDSILRLSRSFGFLAREVDVFLSKLDIRIFNIKGNEKISDLKAKLESDVESINEDSDTYKESEIDLKIREKKKDIKMEFIDVTGHLIKTSIKRYKTNWLEKPIKKNINSSSSSSSGYDTNIFTNNELFNNVQSNKKILKNIKIFKYNLKNLNNILHDLQFNESLIPEDLDEYEDKIFQIMQSKFYNKILKNEIHDNFIGVFVNLNELSIKGKGLDCDKIEYYNLEKSNDKFKQKLKEFIVKDEIINIEFFVFYIITHPITPIQYKLKEKQVEEIIPEKIVQNDLDLNDKFYKNHPLYSDEDSDYDLKSSSDSSEYSDDLDEEELKILQEKKVNILVYKFLKKQNVGKLQMDLKNMIDNYNTNYYGINVDIDKKKEKIIKNINITDSDSDF